MILNGRAVFHSTQVGVDDDGRLEVKRPMLRRVWLPMGALPRRALGVARDVLSFLQRLSGRTRQELAVTAAGMIVDHLIFDWCTAGIINKKTDLKTPPLRWNVTTFKTVEEVVRDVLFHDDRLPSTMVMRATIKMAKDIVGEQLLATEVKKALLPAARHIPTPIVHARQTTFSPDRMTLLLSSRRFGEPLNASRLIAGTQSLLTSRTTWSRLQVTKVVTVNQCTLAIVKELTTLLGTMNTPCSDSQLLGLVAIVLALRAMHQNVVKKVSIRRLYRSLHVDRVLLMDDLNDVVMNNVQ